MRRFWTWFRSLWKPTPWRPGEYEEYIKELEESADPRRPGE